MLRLNATTIVLFSFVVGLIQSKMVLVHLIFRHGDKVPDRILMQMVLTPHVARAQEQFSDAGCLHTSPGKDTTFQNFTVGTILTG
ncbi:hypothetical protein Trydic_g1578 [Trypoxylus dichotomus]